MINPLGLFPYLGVGVAMLVYEVIIGQRLVTHSGNLAVLQFFPPPPPKKNTCFFPQLQFSTDVPGSRVGFVDAGMVG